MKTSKLRRATVVTGMTLAAIGSMPLAHAEAATGTAKKSVSRPASVSTGRDRLPGAAGSVSPAGRPRQVAGTTFPTARAPWVFSGQ